MSFPARISLVVSVVALAGCGAKAERPAASPQVEMTAQIDKILVTENGVLSVVERDGCMATVKSEDELHTRCAKPERMQAWFEGADKVAAKIATEPVKSGHAADDVDPSQSSAKMLTTAGKSLRVMKAADIAKLNADVRALSDELAGAEKMVVPGPASEHGWQMVHVKGPARVMFAGTPTRGRFEARLSTSGQYLCEFTTASADGAPVTATKSGWIKPASAVHAVDVVLAPLGAAAPDSAPTSFAAGTKAGAEQRSNAAGTAAVFELFGEVQDALGDACLPELEPPATASRGI
jgi:hypothetical protein